MQAPLRVLFAASEYAPLTKTGGLADVAAALPAALLELGIDVRVLIPGYRAVMRSVAGARVVARVPAHASFPAARLLHAEGPQRQPLLVLDCAALYDRDAGPYQDSTGQDWDDNALRFGYLSYVAALLGGPNSPCEWQCDVLHCNDWQTGLAPAYQYWSGERHAPSLMTIHNIAYQGVFPAATVSVLGLPSASFSIDGLEYYGSMSFLKAGLYYATRLSTVSPTYAREIQSEPLGFGLHGLLAARHAVLEGILNGIDTIAWNAATDSNLAANYDASTLAKKRINTDALRRRFGLNSLAEIPLLGIVSRLIPQKGIDLVAAIADRLTRLPAQLLVLGTGEAAIERDLAALAERHPGMIAVVRGFDEALSHLVEAGADIFLMPSRFEPCGLNQMYSQRYGTAPIVRRTGGLADSVVDCNPATIAAGTGTGFLFDVSSADTLFAAIERAVVAWRNAHAWQQIQRNCMARDFSWTQSARRYAELYRTLLAGA